MNTRVNPTFTQSHDRLHGPLTTQSVHYTINSTTQSVHNTISQRINQYTISRTISQTTSQSQNQSVNQSINVSVNPTKELIKSIPYHDLFAPIVCWIWRRSDQRNIQRLLVATDDRVRQVPPALGHVMNGVVQSTEVSSGSKSPDGESPDTLCGQQKPPRCSANRELHPVL